MSIDASFLASESWTAEMPERLRWLRQHSPIHWSAKDDLFLVTKYTDVVEVSKDQERFTSAHGVRPGSAAKLALIDESGARHTQLRRLISRGFTPRRVAKLEPAFRRLAREALDQVAARGECDFVESYAAPLPLLLIGEMIGVRRSDRARFQRWTDDMIAADGNASDPEVMQQAGLAFAALAAYVNPIFESRRKRPKDDLISILVGAQEDGVLGELGVGADEAAPGLPDPQLANDELLMLLVLLLVAGNETTRNALSGGLAALIEHPAARAELLADPNKIPAAVEEILRWVSPVHSFARTATRDTELRDQEIRAGQRLLMIYPSANRDEEAFAEPDRFDIGRNPQHLAFGLGSHYCLGANLARMELRVALEEWLARLPDASYADAEGAVLRPSALVRSCTRMRVRYTPA
jgi:cytochrome P450 family 142 subfamily A polypeptide 1